MCPNVSNATTTDSDAKKLCDVKENEEDSLVFENLQKVNNLNAVEQNIKLFPINTQHNVTSNTEDLNL
ncbi:unnamed protein product [Diabrotica balteata]|uniref:Uncharacterized protein n=1 Tax=Diabrotica balteata TaxID=107213 RepID=A0A9N9SQ14_DIABA|nr:unnamed protein product [Diabrotica balteata]